MKSNLQGGLEREEGGREGGGNEKTEGGRNRIRVKEVKYAVQCSQKAVSGQRILITR